VVEQNEISVGTYGALGVFSAAFPVRISNNVFGRCGVGGQWLGFTLRLRPGPVMMKNDYRLIESGGTASRSAILLASENDLKAVTGVGGEVKNNLIIETGRFPQGTGGARSNIEILIGLPYVHDNRIVGEPASEIQDPGIGATVRAIMPLITGQELDY